MKVSEKSLELNVGAELLDVLRHRCAMPKAYLRGLTQREEHQEGVDFLAELSSSTRIFAFQFKAPKGQWGDKTPYRFTIQRHQHEKLSALSTKCPSGVFYVLPFYVCPAKLRHDVPQLLRDTWFPPSLQWRERTSSALTRPRPCTVNVARRRSTRTTNC